MRQPEFYPIREDFLEDTHNKLAVPDRSRISSLIAPSTMSSDLQRRYAPDGDPFGLLEIDDTYEKVLGKGYEQAINLVEHVLPTQDRASRRDWKKGERVALPEHQLGDFLSYQLFVQRDPETGEGYVHFTRTDDDNVSNRGFTITKGQDGHIVLKDSTRGDTDISNDETYGEMVDKSVRWIHEYATHFGLTPEALNSKPIHLSTTEHIRYIAVDTLHTGENIARRAFRPLGTIALVGALLAGGNTYFENRASHKRAVKVAAAKAEQARIKGMKDFDAKGLHLPDEPHIFHVGDVAKVDFDPNISDAITKNAPGVYFYNQNNPEEFKNGIRHMVGTWGTKEVPSSLGTEEPYSCLNAIVDVSPSATAKILSTDAKASSTLTANFNRKSLGVCNTSGKLITSGFDQVYVEISDPK